MARTFNNQFISNISAKKDFGVFLESQDAGDYILNKSAQTKYCTPNICKSSIKVGSQGNYLTYQLSNRLTINSNCLNTIDKTNLDINLITKLNLKDIPTIVDFSNNKIPVNVNNSSLIPPYLQYNIDPKGYLFGNTICGVDNYLRYLEYNSPDVDAIDETTNLNE